MPQFALSLLKIKLIFLTMTMLIDMKECIVPFAEISEKLGAKGEEMNLSIRVQREDIFDKMHRI